MQQGCLSILIFGHCTRKRTVPYSFKVFTSRLQTYVPGGEWTTLRKPLLCNLLLAFHSDRQRTDYP